MIGLRGILGKYSDPTAEPDPDNAGGGKKPEPRRPPLRAFFLPSAPFRTNPGVIQVIAGWMNRCPFTGSTPKLHKQHDKVKIMR